jgi:ABC-type branched-subunit amino acid transport system ATPase component
MYTIKILDEFFGQHKLKIIAYIIFSILSQPFEAIAIPRIYTNFFDALQETKITAALFIKYLSLITGCIVFSNISRFIIAKLEENIIPELFSYITNYIYKNLLLKYENSYTDIEVGKVITIMLELPHNVKKVVVDIAAYLLPKFLTIIALSIYFCTVNLKLGLTATILFMIFIFYSLNTADKCTSLSNKQQQMLEQSSQNTQDRLSNLYSIYTYGKTKSEIKDFRENLNKFVEINKKSLNCANTNVGVSYIINAVSFCSLNIIAAYLLFNKQITLKQLMAVFMAVLYYSPCISDISVVIAELTHYGGTLLACDDFAEDLYNVQNFSKDTNNEKDAIELKNGKITINNLSFAYNKEDKKLFHDFHLNIPSGQKIALMGGSASGKSTLIKLIMGFYPVPDNSIYINGICINKHNLNNLRNQITYINQNTKLFNKTVLENIQYGNDLSKSEVESLCKKMNVSNVFATLPNGLDSECGVGGDNLSGGQRQLVHLLRNMASNNKIIILDEPTAAIDAQNTENIIRIIKELSKNSTLILITHDKSLIGFCDRILTLAHGKIINDRYNQQ